MRYVGLIVAGLVAGCGDEDCCKAGVDAAHDAPVIPPDTLDVCAGPGREKIQFTREASCGNDGAVEWCIPDSDPELVATLAAISSTIHCAPGGGRAGCYTGGKLLCSYPTHYPDQCLARWGEMKPEVWDDICQVAAQPQITAIVPMILE
jgi:hypothetical protein